MRQNRVTYTIGDPPKALKGAQMDNISLVPASLLSLKGKYQTITNNLPRGGVLICETPQKPRIGKVLSRVGELLREKGHIVRILPYSVLVKAY